MGFTNRALMYKHIEKEFNAKVIAYVTGDRPGVQAQIASDVPDIMLEHLDIIGSTNRIVLILYTLGGDTLAAWNIINLIKEFCKELIIIVPNKCRSAGTLMCLGANEIIMTKQATLGPIDPSINSPLTPYIPNTNPPVNIPVSVESIKGYFDLLKNIAGADDNVSAASAYAKLVEKLHPLVLGDVYRIRNQIQMLAKSLLKSHINDADKIQNVVDFLCSDSGSHNYTISRTEARNLGLNIKSPNDECYQHLKNWNNNIVIDMDLNIPYNPPVLLGSDVQKVFVLKRVLIESLGFGQDAHVTKVVLSKMQPMPGATQIAQDVLFEGWTHA